MVADFLSRLPTLEKAQENDQASTSTAMELVEPLATSPAKVFVAFLSSDVTPKEEPEVDVLETANIVELQQQDLEIRPIYNFHAEGILPTNPKMANIPCPNTHLTIFCMKAF